MLEKRNYSKKKKILFHHTWVLCFLPISESLFKITLVSYGKNFSEFNTQCVLMLSVTRMKS